MIGNRCRIPSFRPDLLAGLAGSFLALLASTGAMAQSLQTTESIRLAAQEIAEQSVGMELESTDASTASVSVGQVDPRLRVPECDQPLEGFLPTSNPARSNLTVGVRCNGSSPWTVYVPVKITMMRPVVVLTRPVARGALLTAQDIDVDIRDVGSNTAYFEDPAAVLGKVLTRAGSAGQTLNPAHLANSTAVKRGQQVSLVANSNGILVRITGTAMADAAIGDRLKVKNNSSARVVEGTVLADGSVDVSL
jgi:flagellar basal body P-ring formation protein FlgA